MVINLEMQVANEYDWTDRSLLYLCRAYDQLKKGEEYKTILPAIHIGFLDFHAFPKHPEFYATYMLLNTKNHHLYSDKFVLRVVDLTCIDIATDEDKSYGIDHWARLFKSTTWEELTNMNATLAEKDAVIAKKDAENAHLKALLEEHNIPI